jgi:flagellar biosynthesis/type III secretory pathway ATPase
MDMVASEPHLRDARALRHTLSLLDRIKDARSLGIESVDNEARAAIAIENQIGNFLRQGRLRCDRVATLSQLARLAELTEYENGDR